MGIFDFLKKNKNIKNDNGLNETYYDDGKGVLAEKFYKKNGKLDGLYEFYRFKWIGKTDYHLELVGNYKNGQKEGIWKWYFSDEKTIKKVGKYKNGQKEGIWKEYFVNAEGELNLKSEYNYKEGKLNGISKYIFKGSFVLSTYQEKTELKKYKNGEIVYCKTYEFVKDDINEIIFGNLYYEWYRNGLVNYYENGELTKTIPPKITPEQLMKKYGLDADDFIYI